MATPTYIVYVHRNKTNGKVYVGITKQSVKKRWQSGYGYAYSNPEFYNDIKDFGWDNFEHLIISEKLTAKEASKKEAELIDLYNSTNPTYGYNKIMGGIRPKRPDISLMMSKRTGALNPNYGKPAPAKTRAALLHHSKYGQFGSNNHRAQAVSQFTKDGHFIRNYETITEAVKTLNLSTKSHICTCCQGKRKSAHGYIWKYKKEE